MREATSLPIINHLSLNRSAMGEMQIRRHKCMLCDSSLALCSLLHQTVCVCGDGGCLKTEAAAAGAIRLTTQTWTKPGIFSVRSRFQQAKICTNLSPPNLVNTTGFKSVLLNEFDGFIITLEFTVSITVKKTTLGCNVTIIVYQT